MLCCTGRLEQSCGLVLSTLDGGPWFVRTRTQIRPSRTPAADATTLGDGKVEAKRRRGTSDASPRERSRHWLTRAPLAAACTYGMVAQVNSSARGWTP
jgi:hypothetical protein